MIRWLLACTPPDGATPSEVATGLPTPSGTPAPTAPPGTPSLADAALVQALVDGADAPSLGDVLLTVARSGGWPVEDGAFTWFVAEDTGAGPLSVAGDFDGWVGTPMTRGDGFWWARLELGAAAGVRYKYTDGPDWTADPWARSFDYDENGEISYVAAPTDAPRLDRWPGIAGEGIAPRTLQLAVPAGAGPWPTLYMADGQNLFDPAASWGGWRLRETLASREPMLVVGIENTVDRFEEYTHVPDDVGLGGVMGGNGDTYAAFVDEVVRPLVESEYGVAPVAGVAGSSLGGLVSLVIAQARPGRYQFAASMSGTLGWGRFALDEETIEERFLAAPPGDLVVYVDSGGSPGDDGACVDVDGDGFPEDDPDAADNYCESRQFVDRLAAQGFTWDEDLFHWWEPNAPHDEAAWADRAGGMLDRFLAIR